MSEWVAERHRGLQAAGGLFAVAGGVGWIFHPGWALVVIGVGAIADVVAEAVRPLRRAAQ